MEDTNFEDAIRAYIRKYPKREGPVRQVGTSITDQSYVDLGQMAQNDHKSRGAFLDWLIAKEVRKRAKRIAEQNLCIRDSALNSDSRVA